MEFDDQFQKSEMKQTLRNVITQIVDPCKIVELNDVVKKSLRPNLALYEQQDISRYMKYFQDCDNSIFYCLFIISKYTNDLTIFAINTLEKYVKEKWDKFPDDEKKVIRYFIFDNLNIRIKIFNENNIDKKRQYLLLSINKLNFIIVQIALKDWPKSWPNLIGELCDKAKSNLSYESENCMKLLILLSHNINKNFEEMMTTMKNIELKQKMHDELDKILNLIKYFLVEKLYELINSNNNQDNNTNNNMNDNSINVNKNLSIIILKQSIKLYDEFISWFDVKNILDKSIIQNLLLILNRQICKNEIIANFIILLSK